MRCSHAFLLARRDEHRARALLLSSMMPMARLAAAEYRIQGYEYDDLLAAAMLGVNQAIDAWDPTRGASFNGLAKSFAHCRVIDLMVEAGRLKRRLLRDALSLDMQIADDYTLADVLPGISGEQPMEMLLSREAMSTVGAALDKCSETERRVMLAHLEGFSYLEIADQIGCDAKSVDNALQRARKRLGRVLA